MMMMKEFFCFCLMKESLEVVEYEDYNVASFDQIVIKNLERISLSLMQ